MIDLAFLLRPADIFIPNWSVEGDLAIDVTVRHPLPPFLFPATTFSYLCSNGLTSIPLTALGSVASGVHLDG